MRIVDANSFTIEIPFELHGSGVGIMPTPWRSLEFALVRLVDDRGNVGWGEGFGYFTVKATKALLDRLLLPTLIGQDIEDIAKWNIETQRRIHMFGRFGVTIFAISAIDMALWDLRAKRENRALCDILARGPVQRSVGSYASLSRYGDSTLIETACGQVLDEGFQAVKVHEIELDLIRSARERIGNVALCADVNCGWTSEFVNAHKNDLADLKLDWLEEPIFPPEDFAALAALRGGPSRIGAGENWCTARQCQTALDCGAVDVFQPSVTKIGGISEYISAIDYAADFHDVRIFPHSPYFGPGFFASLHVAAARPEISMIEYNFVKPDAWLCDIDGLRDGGTFTVPDCPGLGFEPDEDIFQRYLT